MPEPVLSERDGNIGRITLNRPDAMNAVTVDLARALEAGLRDLAADVNVIVVRGAGGNFSVGGDFKALEALREEGESAMRELFESFARACGAIAEVPVPVVAAVEGYAIAGGFELMQACDFALVREDARIGDNHSNFGQIPGGGSSQRLPRLVGRQRALGLMLTGDRISGAEAAAWGLAYRAYPAEQFDSAVADVVERLAPRAGSPWPASRRSSARASSARSPTGSSTRSMPCSRTSGRLGRRGHREVHVAMSEALIDSGPVLLDLDGSVARIRLNRPEAFNGLDVPLLRPCTTRSCAVTGSPAPARCSSAARARASAPAATSRPSPPRARTCPTTCARRRLGCRSRRRRSCASTPRS